jgi:outer membrane protein with beta-barrel domain
MKTLKALIIIGLILNLGLKLQAQDIHFGFLSGLGITNACVTNKVEIYNDYRVFYPMGSFNINGSIEYKFSKTFGIAAEPGFIRKGGIVRFGVNHYMDVIKLKLNYVQLPIFVNIYCTNKFFITIGPEFAYLINSEGKLPETATGFAYFKENAFEISGLIGINYRITKKIDVGFRYNHGLTNISVLKWTDGYGPEIGQSKVYNQYFQFIFRFKIQTGANK